jgi:hypothetical protein
MSEDRYEAWLDDYVDGTLKEPDRRLLESHLAVCESCRTLADDLGKIKKAAGSLPRLSPPAKVWQQIESTLRAQQPPASRFYFSLMSSPWAIAASAALLIGALGLFLWWNRTEEPPADDPAALAGYVTEELQQAEKHYDNAISGLEQILDKENQDAPLDPEVMAVLNDNLDLIEQAIGESRAAALKDPGDETARESFLTALKQKLSLLQNTIMLINEVRKGRGETAYDLLEEMREAQSPSDPM